jgi:hypothetical protein
MDLAADLIKRGEKARVEELYKKFPFWGWNQHKGLRCKNNNNTGCNTYWSQSAKALYEVGTGPFGFVGK